LALVLQMTVRGMPVVTWGDELARVGGKWPDNRPFMNWAALAVEPGRATHRQYRRMIHLRRHIPAFRGRAFTTLYAETTPQSATVVFARGEGVGKRLVALHRGPMPTLFRLPNVETNGETPKTSWCLDFSSAPDALLESTMTTTTERFQRLVLPADTAVIVGACPVGQQR